MTHINTFEEKDFFREATLRICGSLEIEKALWHCFLYLQNHIPATQMSLHLYDHGVGLIETVAHATSGGGEILSIKTPVSTRIRKEVEERPISRLRVVERMGDYEGTREVARKLNSQDLPCIIMDLVLEHKFLGVLSVTGELGKKFKKEHLRLLSLLNEPVAIALTNSMRFRELEKLRDLLADDNRYFQDELRRLSGEEVIGAEFGLRGVIELVRQVAHLESPVLLSGETGVGKEIIAGMIHNMSSRRSGPFIKVNCGAIPESLLDSELFGHEKGAFTGAISQKRGRFERAHGGTIFLDEIGELSPEAQVRLLRVLQEKEIERVGGTQTIRVDIRVIAATHRDLLALQLKGQFREDLYFRLNVFPVVIPPLRERIFDLPALVHHFIQKKARDMKLSRIPSLATGAMDHLMSYQWPGNVRELENAVERALILSKDQPLTFDQGLMIGSDQSIAPTPGSDMKNLNLDQAMSEHIRKALRMARGKIHGKGGAAELLGIHPMTLRNRMKKLGIPFGRKIKIIGM